MRRGRARRLPFDLPLTPVADLIERQTGTRDEVKAFDADFSACGPRFEGDPARWRDAYAALGVPLPDDAEDAGEIALVAEPAPPGDLGKRRFGRLEKFHGQIDAPFAAAAR